MTSRRRMMAGANLTSLGVIDGVIQDDWDKICQIAKAGKASSFYEVGNTKQLSWGYQGTLNMMLVGIDVDTRSDGKGMANMTWITLDVFSKQVPYENCGNQSYGPNWGYDQALIRYYAEGLSILLPDIVRQSIVTVNKTYLFQNVTSSIEAKVWLPSVRELSEYKTQESSGPVYSNFPATAWAYMYGSMKVFAHVPSRTSFGENTQQINAKGNVSQDRHVGTNNPIAVGFCL